MCVCVCIFVDNMYVLIVDIVDSHLFQRYLKSTVKKIDFLLVISRIDKYEYMKDFEIEPWVNMFKNSLPIIFNNNLLPLKNLN